ncbi:hypothetical protein B0J13DRAFT_626200 [Dactylonectria estremocensis]|uniref:Enoyl reductase (ER) domain-containing protein n=1 Tax=Dactylonectria estremocensis TaxID=1079267 RepID=A0A9P9E9R0_9HYPO|nr:hypothetical protein B0J13DRAFT_626200 [Dactylonectria estremocensis]
MKAIRIHPSDNVPWSASNPAPSTALVLDHVPIPQPNPSQVLVRVHAATVTRDELTWPESYHKEHHIPGYDFSGVVESVGGDAEFNPGDEVFAMVQIHRGSTWAEFAVAEAGELALKPKSLTWAETVTVPLSSLTAWQALFVKAGIREPDFESQAQTDQTNQTGHTVLVTGASGAVGSYIVQLAALAGLRVVAASSSNQRNGEFLKSLGAAETIEYADLKQHTFDLIIDTVGGEPLAQAWAVIAETGALISVDSSSYAFSDNPPAGKENVKAQFFIVEPSGEQLAKISRALELGLVRPFLAHTFPLAEARTAYEMASGRMDRRGKVVVEM